MLFCQFQEIYAYIFPDLPDVLIRQHAFFLQLLRQAERRQNTVSAERLISAPILIFVHRRCPLPWPRVIQHRNGLRNHLLVQQIIHIIKGIIIIQIHRIALIFILICRNIQPASVQTAQYIYHICIMRKNPPDVLAGLMIAGPGIRNLYWFGFPELIKLTTIKVLTHTGSGNYAVIIIVPDNSVILVSFILQRILQKVLPAVIM